jgi:S-adenosylmethionine:tRNA ribosyltransferase-isomerase
VSAVEAAAISLCCACYTPARMDPSLFDYDLPPSAIAQEPVEPRDASRLLVVDRARQTWTDHRFADLPELCREGDCLVINTSRVLPARMRGTTSGGGHPVELLLVRALGPTRWQALTRPGRRCRRGVRIALASGEASAVVVEEHADGSRLVEIEAPWPVPVLLARHGLTPLPPYIARYHAPKPEDRERYQTIYATEDGSVAAPTAGLHFTAALLERLRDRGVEVRALRLHVGPATFRPIRTARVEDHHLDAESVSIPTDTARAVNLARAEGRRIVAVGTTTTRALEWAVHEGTVRASTGLADLFIHPPYSFQVVGALLTNFHLPRSSLLVLIAAFAGRELVLAAYRHAVAAGYRFYSYGDAMLVV